MTERDQKIIEQLNKCGVLQRSIDDAKHKISIAQDAVEYAEATKPTMQQTEAYRETNEYKKKILLFGIIGIVSALLVGLFFMLYNNKIESTKGAQEITVGEYGYIGTGDPGEEYQKWLNSWSNYTYFEELENGWKAVQNDWQAKGIDITWEYVKNIWDNLPVGDINRFNSSLMSSINKEYVKEARQEATALIGFAIVFAIPFIVALLITLYNVFLFASTKSINSTTKELNRLAERYNNGKYLELLAEWEENYSKSQKELSKVRKANNSKISELMSELSEEEYKLYQTFNIEKCHYPYSDVAWIMQCEYLSYERALQKCREDKQEAQRQYEEELIRREQERHNNEMERYAREQAQAVREQAQAAREQTELINKAMKEQKRASEAKCRRCANLGRCSVSMRIDSTSCGAFIPK